jgi:hypothetical protein
LDTKVLAIAGSGSFPDLTIGVGITLVGGKSTQTINEAKSTMLLQPVKPGRGSNDDGIAHCPRLV